MHAVGDPGRPAALGGARRSGPGRHRAAGGGARRPGSTAPTWCSGWASTRPRRAGPQDIPGMELAGEVVAVRALRCGSSRRATGSWRWSGAGRRRPWPSSTSPMRWPSPTRCPGPRRGGSPRCSRPPTTPCSPRPVCGWASGCWSAGRRAASGTAGRPAGRRDRRATWWPRCATRPATTRSPVLGADAVIAPGEVARHGPYDVVLELVGAASLTDGAAPSGHRGPRRRHRRRVGRRAMELNLIQLMTKRARIGGATLRCRTRQEKADVAAGVAAHVLPLLTPGRHHRAGVRHLPPGRGRRRLRALRRGRQARQGRARRVMRRS